MALQIASLNSGSNANCYFIGNKNESILIDAGLSCRETERRMLKLGLDMAQLNAIFITHEHSDHISGLETISKKYKLPVYITSNTLRSSRLRIDNSLIRSFEDGKAINVGELEILPFSKSHDAWDPHSFVIKHKSIHIGVITDIGYACKNVIKHFKLCDAVFLETNYCDEMLESGSYPRVLKKRISGRKGHLSNDQALQLFLKHKPANLQLLILSHLSENNNHPDKVNALFSKNAGDVRIVIASRDGESELFAVERAFNRLVTKRNNKLVVNKQQLSLFDFK